EPRRRFGAHSGVVPRAPRRRPRQRPDVASRETFSGEQTQTRIDWALFVRVCVCSAVPELSTISGSSQGSPLRTIYRATGGDDPGMYGAALALLDERGGF